MSHSPVPASSTRASRGLGDAVAPLAIVILAGLLLALGAALAGWREFGCFTTLHHGDVVLYLQFSSQYFFHGQGLDPVTGKALTLYPKLVMGLPAWLVARVGWSPFAVLAIWKTWAALGLATGFYLVFWQGLRRRWPSALSAIVVLAFPGLGWVRWFLHAAASGRGGPLPPLPPLWRIVDPAVSLPLLLLAVLSVQQLRTRVPGEVSWRDLFAGRLGTTGVGGWLLLSGAALALLVYTYFYYWTAALLALCLVAVLDRKALPLYFAAGTIALAVGMPGLLHGLWLRQQTNPDALRRLNVFISVPHWSWRVRHLGSAVICLLLLPWVRRHRPRLVYLWSVAFSGFLLSDSQIVTGLQIQNNHWYRFLVNPLVMVLVVLFIGWLLLESAVTGKRRRHGWRVAAGLILVLLFAMAGEAEYLTAGRTLRSSLNRNLRSVLLDWPAHPPRGGTIAGDLCLADVFSVASAVRPLSGYAALASAPMSDLEFEQRWALNEYLVGRSRAQLGSDLSELLGSLFGSVTLRNDDGPVMRPAELQALTRGSAQVFDQISANPGQLLRRFDVRWLVLSPGQQPLMHVGKRLQRMATTPGWTLFRFARN